MKMHRMPTNKTVVNEMQTDAGVAAKVVHIPLRFIIEVTVLGLQEDGLIVVTAVGAVVDEPDKVGTVTPELEVELLSRGGLLERDLTDRNALRQLIVLADSQLIFGNIRHRGRD